jgi:hypothetical protein
MLIKQLYGIIYLYHYYEYTNKPNHSNFLLILEKILSFYYMQHAIKRSRHSAYTKYFPD